MRVIFVFFSCLLLLSACGGGSSSKSSNSGQSSKKIISSTKSSLSSASFVGSSLSQKSSAASSVVVVVERHVVTDEDKPLIIELDANIRLGGYAGPGALISAYAHYTTQEGGRSWSESLGNTIYYTPKTDFYGQDRFSYWIYENDTVSKKIEFIVEVNPIVDLQPRIYLPEKQAYAAGDVLRIPFPAYPDENITLTPDSSTKLYFEGALLAFEQHENYLEVILPAITLAGTHNILYTQLDGAREINFPIALQMVIRKSNIEYFIGNESRPGQTIVLVRTDNVSDGQYSEWINWHLLEFLREPLVTAFQPYWNFVVIKPAGEAKLKAYGDVWAADAPYFSRFVSEYVSANTKLIVLDGRQFRASGGHPITMNVFNDSRVLFHELGHSHAKLGDEYTDAGNAGSPYSEGIYPNVSASGSNTKSIPWSHWINDWSIVPGQNVKAWDHNSVGAFLGAFYYSDRYYRPAYRSLMRVPAAPPSPVDEETWALANYEALGLLASAAVNYKVGLAEVSISREWDKSLTRVNWFLNGVELTEYANQAKIFVDEKQVVEKQYSIKVVLTDLTGRIKNPHAYRAFNTFIDPITHQFVDDGVNKTFERSWTLHKFSSVAAKQNSQAKVSSIAKTEQWTSHLIVVKNGVHQLDSTRHYNAQGTVPPVTGESHFSVEILSDGDALLYEQGVSLRKFDAGVIPVPFVNESAYNIVHPKITGAYQIKIYTLPERELVAEYSL
ncbi:MAG: M64 family metallopeptidase [Cellvibrio sp.]|uniref:hypothetical protein n=1 Tax=Cellvibrio sp. TaxID=1965322 RepID=UPI0031AF8A37